MTNELATEVCHCPSCAAKNQPAARVPQVGECVRNLVKPKAWEGMRFRIWATGCETFVASAGQLQIERYYADRGITWDFDEPAKVEPKAQDPVEVFSRKTWPGYDEPAKPAGKPALDTPSCGNVADAWKPESVICSLPAGHAGPHGEGERHWVETGAQSERERIVLALTNAYRACPPYSLHPIDELDSERAEWFGAVYDRAIELLAKPRDAKIERLKANLLAQRKACLDMGAERNESHREVDRLKKELADLQAAHNKVLALVDEKQRAQERTAGEVKGALDELARVKAENERLRGVQGELVGALQDFLAGWPLGFWERAEMLLQRIDADRAGKGGAV